MDQSFARFLAPVARLLSRRHGGLVLFLLIFVGVAQFTRLVLLGQAARVVSWDVSLLGAWAIGFVYDCAAGLLWGLPLWLALTVLPAGFFSRWWGRALAHIALMVALYALLFGAVAEWLFWDEFSTRFNFIAVDYLVYTQEVVGNIRESYPMPAILVGLGVLAVVGYVLLVQSGLVGNWLSAPAEPWARRWRAGLCWLVAVVVAAVALEDRYIPGFANNYHRELAKNGLWSLFAAFRNNELVYEQFYRTAPIDEAFGTLRQALAADGADLPVGPARDTLRAIRNPGPELHPNIIQITVESLSAE
ncbi:MAG TPA: LTA synthase family protein, partial [Opitutaceae bacterium]|nr:LTA synthase family protein [Opitutaceae bacterium]